MNWSEKEIDDWISLDDRILEAKIETPFLTPMNPLEIRAKYLQDVLDDVLCERPSLTYSEAILFLEKEFEKETTLFSVTADILVVILNIVISYFMNKGFLKKYGHF